MHGSIPPMHEPLLFGDKIKLTIPKWGGSVLIVNSRPYLKINYVGKGGSSVVYKAMAEDGSFYAIKRVNMTDADADTLASYRQEIQLLQRLQKYEHVIQLIDFQYQPEAEYMFIILEYGEIDLARILARYPEGLLDRMNHMRLYWQQMLEAVSVIHSEEERIVHGDIKPQNFVSVKDQLKLIDFGIAKAIHHNTLNIERETLIGTVNYLAPETTRPTLAKTTKYGRVSRSPARAQTDGVGIGHMVARVHTVSDGLRQDTLPAARMEAPHGPPQLG